MKMIELFRKKRELKRKLLREHDHSICHSDPNQKDETASCFIDSENKPIEIQETELQNLNTREPTLVSNNKVGFGNDLEIETDPIYVNTSSIGSHGAQEDNQLLAASRQWVRRNILDLDKILTNGDFGS